MSAALQPSPWWALAAPLTAAAAWQAWQVREGARQGRRLAARARAFECHPPAPGARVLLGDSTAVGVGAPRPEDSLPGLLAQAHPGVQVVNRSANGARVADLPAQLAEAPGRFEVVLVLAGGNDVLRLTPHAALRDQAAALLQALQPVADRTVWLGSANIGGSPRLRGPLRWWMAWRTGRTMALLAREAARHGATFIDFFRPLREDLFARQAGLYFAADGVHPSAASYRHCFEVLQRHTPLATVLAR